MHEDAMAVAPVAQKDRVRSFFDESRSWQGDFYATKNEYFARLIQRRKEYAINMLGRVPHGKGGTALDIGCGAGAYLEELVALGYTATGVDLSQEMLASSRRRFAASGTQARPATPSPPVTLLQGDAENLPVDDSRFDLVLCIGVLGYLIRDEKALTEILRVLKPGGHLLLNVTNLYSLSDIDFHLRKKLRALIRPGRRKRAAPDDLAYASHSDWMLKNRQYFNKSYRLRTYENLLRQYGLRRVDRMTFGFEFRVLRRLRLIPPAWLDRLELLLESTFRRFRVPYLSSSGWGYIGLFERIA